MCGARGICALSRWATTHAIARRGSPSPSPSRTMSESSDNEDEAIAMASAMGFGLEYARGGVNDGGDVEVRWFELAIFDFVRANAWFDWRRCARRCAWISGFVRVCACRVRVTDRRVVCVMNSRVI